MGIYVPKPFLRVCSSKIHRQVFGLGETSPTGHLPACDSSTPTPLTKLVGPCHQKVGSMRGTSWPFSTTKERVPPPKTKSTPTTASGSGGEYSLSEAKTNLRPARLGFTKKGLALKAAAWQMHHLGIKTRDTFRTDQNEQRKPSDGARVHVKGKRFAFGTPLRPLVVQLGRSEMKTTQLVSFAFGGCGGSRLRKPSNLLKSPTIPTQTVLVNTCSIRLGVASCGPLPSLALGQDTLNQVRASKALHGEGPKRIFRSPSFKGVPLRNNWGKEEANHWVPGFMLSGVHHFWSARAPSRFEIKPTKPTQTKPTQTNQFIRGQHYDFFGLNLEP